jgi:hypothetical protein
VLLLPTIVNPGNLNTLAGGPFTRQLQTPDGPLTFRCREPRTRLTALCSEIGVELFDPTEAFRTHIAMSGDMKKYWPASSDRHFSSAGHALLAELCADWFAQLLAADEPTTLQPLDER